MLLCSDLLSTTSSHHSALLLLMYCDMSDTKKISLILCHLRKQQKMWKHFSVNLGHAVSPAVLTQVKSY